MAATIVLECTTGRDTSTLIRDFQRSGNVASSTAQKAALRQVIQFLEQARTGGELNPIFQLLVKENGTQASQTITLTSAVTGKTITIGGTVLTSNSGSPGANQFKVGVSNTADAAALAAAINANSTLSKQVTATSASNVVTVTAMVYHEIANGVSIASNDASMVCGGAFLAGGARDSGALTMSF